MSQSGWIGVDLDGTLAQYEKFEGPEIIGEPIPLMVNRVKGWLAEGRIVKIMTARVYHPRLSTPPSDEQSRGLADAVTAAVAIQKWCKEHIGQVLPVTCEKDYHMYQLWDDRAIQVIPNTGLRTVMIKRLLCRLGFHRWNWIPAVIGASIGVNGICARCRVYRRIGW